MDREKTARCLIIKYLEQCGQQDEARRDEIEVAIDCLKSIWNVEDTQVNIPGVSSLIDLIPAQVYDNAKAVELKTVGNQLLQSGNIEGAIEKYTEAIAADPTVAAFYGNRAAAYSKLNQHQKAIEDCEKAIQLDSTYATAYSRLGFAQWSLGNVEAAREAYRRGLRACPNNQSLRENLESLGPEPAQQTGGAGMPDFQNLAGLFQNIPGLAGIQERLSSPEVQAALSEPGMQELVQQISQNPASAMSFLQDPRMMRLIGIIMGQQH